jgi:hypothetical protein
MLGFRVAIMFFGIKLLLDAGLHLSGKTEYYEQRTRF